MLIESVSILAILVLMIVIFLRAGHADYSVGVVPLLLVPLVHTLSYAVLRWTDRWIPTIPFQRLVAFCDIGGLALSCLLITLVSMKIKKPRNKKIYILLLVLYNVVLACALVHNMMMATGFGLR